MSDHRALWVVFVAVGLMPSAWIATGCSDGTPSSAPAPPGSPGLTTPSQNAASSGPGPHDACVSTQPVPVPDPPAAGEHAALRQRMVDTQIARPRDGRDPVTDPKVLAAMRAVPRHAFVPGVPGARAYQDYPLPIGHGQTISQPYIVAMMTALLEVTPASRILEIGTGSGYQAAVLAHLTPHVYTIEIVEPLGRRAARILDAQGYDAVEVRIGDGYAGWPEAAPFDGIIVTCAAEQIPEPLWQQLRVGGRIVIPVGPIHHIQQLEVVTKGPQGERQPKTIFPVRFVPMTRDRRE